MKNHPKKSNPSPQEKRRQRQRQVCFQLLEHWVPLASFTGPDETSEDPPAPGAKQSFEDGMKAAGLVLKLLERLAKLDGLDAVEKREPALSETADPLELARRVRAVSPILMARLRLAPGIPTLPPTPSAPEAAVSAVPSAVPSSAQPQPPAPAAH